MIETQMVSLHCFRSAQTFVPQDVHALDPIYKHTLNKLHHIKKNFTLDTFRTKSLDNLIVLDILLKHSRY